MRPFFSYYGSKFRLTSEGYYPEPKGNSIIEPFCGSAGYSTNHHELDITLYDVDPVIVGVWQFLISADKYDIMSLPLGEQFDHVDDIEWSCLGARDFVGFWIQQGSTHPGRKMSKWGSSKWNAKTRMQIADQITMINHWRVFNDSYEVISERSDTTFLDAPYQGSAGRKYRHGNKKIDYAHLSEWSKSRDGFVIVCEGDGADWLDFNPLCIQRGIRGKSKEVIAILGDSDE